MRFARCLVLGGLVLSSCACAADRQALDDLRKLFETDPAAAFEKATQMFEEPKAKGDLDGMMGIIRWLAASGCSQWSAGVFEVMLNAALTLARGAGRWEDVGYLCERQADACYLKMWSTDPWLSFRFLQLAMEAYARAGLADRAAKIETYYAALLRQSPSWLLQGRFADLDLAANLERKLPEHVGGMGLGPAEKAFAERVVRARFEGRDGEALAAMEQLLRAAAVAAPEEGRRWAAVAFVGPRLWYAGAGRLIPLLRELVAGTGDAPGGIGFALGLACDGCGYAWAGKDDTWRDTIYWLYGQMERRVSVPVPPSTFCVSLQFFCRDDELRTLCRRWLSRAESDPAAAASTEAQSYKAHILIQPEVPRDIRRRVMQVVDTYYASAGGAAELLSGRDLLYRAPAPDRPTWALDLGLATRNALGSCRDDTTRVACLEGAARLLDEAGRADLAAQCRRLAEAFKAHDPASLLQCALASAQSLAGESKWEEVAKVLEEAVRAAPQPSANLLQASLLLHEAYLRLGRAAEAEASLGKAWELVNNLPMSAAERANTLVRMADLCGLAAQLAGGQGSE